MKLENNGELLVADYGGVEVRVSEAEVAQIFIERIRSAAAFDAITAEDLLAPQPIDLRRLPEIGTEWNGGLYAGITVYANRPMALVLMPAEKERINWTDACAWATEPIGCLPTRVDSLILFANLRDQFSKDAWYWTDTVRTGGADFAWIQDFGYGDQYYVRKGYDYRARAVRRVAI